MRLLVLSHRLPYPPHKGEKIRALNIVRYLARRHEVHLACLVDDEADLAHLERAKGEVRSLVYERIRPVVRQALALRLLFGSEALTVGCFHSRALQRRVDRLIEHEAIEGVLCSSSPMAEYVFRSSQADRLRHIPRVMDLIDVDSLKWCQYADVSAPWRAWIYRREARCLGTFERRIARELDRVLVVSEQEARCFPGGRPANLTAMSNGVDLEYFTPAHAMNRPLPPQSLVFTGAMSYRPNVEGIVWFAERIFSRIRESVRGAQLYVVGSRPSREVRRLACREGVVVTGFVEDVREYVGSASVCIAPLRIARGIQNKILEAMAMGRSVVATREAFEGVDAEAGRDLLVAEGAEAFAAACVELLRSPERAASIGASARRQVVARYSWSASLRVLDDLFPVPEGDAAAGGARASRDAAV